MTLNVCPSTDFVVLMMCQINNLLFQFGAVSSQVTDTRCHLKRDTQVSSTRGFHVRNSVYSPTLDGYPVSTVVVDISQQY